MKPVIELSCLGSLDLYDRRDGTKLQSVLAQPKRIGVLVYLALARPRGFHSSQALFAMFWPDSDLEHARKALNQTVYVLRRTLGTRTLQRREDGSIALDGELLSCDASRFEEALKDGRPAAALELYRGPLLESFSVADCPEFDHWLDTERERLRRLALGAASELATDERQAGNLVGALGWLRRASELAPYDEALLRARLELHERLGDRSGAVRAFQRFEERMVADLDLQPSEESRALLERIVEGTPTGVPSQPSADLPPAHQGDAASAPARVRIDSFERSARPRAPPAVLAAVVVIALVGGGLWVNGRPDPLARESDALATLDADRVFVAPLSNETGDESLDVLGRMAADWIGQELAGSGILSVVPWASALTDASSTLLDEAASPGEGLWIELAGVTRSRYLVTGTYRRRAGGLGFDVRILDRDRGALVRSINDIEGSAGDPEALLERVRQRVSAALASAADPRLASWERAAHAPPSLEAYRLFSTGMDTFLGWMESGNPSRSMGEAADHFHRAAALDSSFVTPLIWAFYAHEYAGEWRERDSVVRVVEARRERLTPFERALLDAQLAGTRGDWTGRFQAYQRVVSLAPTSEWRYNLAASAMALREYDAAIEILSDLDPDRGWISRWEGYWLFLTRARHLEGDHEAELRDADRYLERYPQSAVALRRKAVVLAALGRTAEAVRLAQSQADAEHPGRHTTLVRYVVNELRAHGERPAADELLARYLVWHDGLSAERRKLARGFDLLILAGRLDEAQALAEEHGRVASRLPQRWTALANLAVIAAIRGETEEARRKLAEIDAADDPSLRGASLVNRALVAAQLGEAERAVSLLRAAYKAGIVVTGHARWELDPIRAHPSFQDFVRGN